MSNRIGVNHDRPDSQSILRFTSREWKQLGAALCVAGLCGLLEIMVHVLLARTFATDRLTFLAVLAAVFATYALVFGVPAFLLALVLRKLRVSAAVAAIFLVVLTWTFIGWHVGFQGRIPWYTFAGILGSAAALFFSALVALLLSGRSNRELIAGLGGLCVILACVAVPQFGYSPVDTPQPDQPRTGWHFLIVVDTLGARHTSLHGYERLTTPNLDLFASHGVVFERAIAASSWTRPSVASLFSSLYVHSTQTDGGSGVLRGETTTLAELFREAGFATAGFTNNMTVSAPSGFDQGFSFFDDFQARLSGRKLFFESILGRYLPIHLVPWLRERLMGAEKLRAVHINSRFFDWFSRNDLPGGFVYLHYMDVHAPYAPPPSFRSFGDRPVDLYDDDVRYWDHELENLLEFLRQNDAYEDATIVITADHGEEFHEHGGTGHGKTIYDEVIHVPLVIRSPALAPGRIEQPVSLVDVGPTLCNLAGTPAFPVSEGRSLIPLIRGESIARGAIMSEIFTSRGRCRVGLLKQPWKLVYRPYSGEAELFNVLDDPDERSNIALREPDVVATLLSEPYQSLFANPDGIKSPRGDGVEAPLGPEVIKTLRALGYVE